MHLAGTVDIDLQNDSLGKDKDGNDVYLNDIWPSSEEVNATVKATVTPELFRKEYETCIHMITNVGMIFKQVTMRFIHSILNQHIFKTHHSLKECQKNQVQLTHLTVLRVVGKFGDSVTTDHISPAGAIGKDTPAGIYLLENGVEIRDFNSYGSRRGNHEVMMRGTFANIRIRNQIAPGTEGGVTTYWPTGDVMAIYDACMKYKAEGTGLVS